MGVINGQNPTLSVLGGSLTLSQDGTQYFTTPTTAGAFTGNLVIGSNTQADIAGSSSAGTPALINGGGTVQIAGTNAGLFMAGQNLSGPGYLEIDNNMVLNSGSLAQPVTTSVGTTTGTFASLLKLGGVISGASSVNFTGGSSENTRGVIEIDAPATYTGNTTINDGALGVVRLGTNDALPATTDLNFGTISIVGGALDMNGYSQTVAGLTVDSPFSPTGIVNTGTATSTLTVNQATDSSYGGTIGTPINPNLYGPGTNLVPQGANLNNINVVKEGPGTLELTQNLTYTGSTQANGGSLIVNGNLSGSDVVSVGAGGTLAGLGEVYVPNGGQMVVNNGGTLAPGDNYAGDGNYLPTGSFGIQDSSATSATYNSNGTFQLKAGGTFAITLGATTAGGSQAPNNIDNNLDSQFYVQGTSSIAGNLSVNLLSDFTANPGDLFFILINIGPDGNESTIPINGVFANAPSTISVPGPQGTQFFDVGYNGNSTNDTFTGGNDIVLQLVAVPEPETISYCVGGLGLLLAFSRRRRR